MRCLDMNGHSWANQNGERSAWTRPWSTGDDLGELFFCSIKVEVRVVVARDARRCLPAQVDRHATVHCDEGVDDKSRKSHV